MNAPAPAVDRLKKIDRLEKIERRDKTELVVIAAIAGILIVAAACRRDFLGDGVRHLPAALYSAPQVGEARWLLFPLLVSVLVKPLAAARLISDVQGAIQAVLWLSVASGLVYLWSLRAWLQAACHDGRRRATALLLAGSCGPFLFLFSDIAEPQVAAALAVSGLAYARVRRDDLLRAVRGAMVAIAAIAVATLIYQGMILAFGMLPLVLSRETLRQRRVAAALLLSMALVPALIVAAQAAAGTPMRLAIETTFGGERNPLTRSMMARSSPAKYVVALVAGAPQGIVMLNNFRGLPALLAGVEAPHPSVVEAAAENVVRLALGALIAWALFATALRRADWRLLLAAAVILILPVLRNEQYAYPKFFVLWPVPIALAALRWRPRIAGLAAAAVLIANAWLLTGEVMRGRVRYAAATHAYGSATPTTCWMASGWAPPMSYLWPGTTAPILGTLATGSEPVVQAAALTGSLRRCFCGSTAVWTDATSLDGPMLADLARHFGYRAVDLPALLPDPAQSAAGPLPGTQIYPDPSRRLLCARLQGLNAP